MNGIKPASKDPLSERECEILEMVATGMDNKEIASTLTLSDATIKCHVNNIYTKLGLTRRHGNPRVLLALYAVRTGVIVMD
jgi:DNA-binding NarL/FixJ family response regulator